MRTHTLRQGNLWIWLVLMLGSFALQTPVLASCDPAKMASPGAASCCAPKQTVCPCLPAEAPNDQAVRAEAFAAQGESVTLPHCPCLASLPRDTKATLPEPLRISGDYALTVPFALLISIPLALSPACPEPEFLTLLDRVCASAPPRAPPFEG